MRTLLILGLGYSASRLAARLRADGWQVTGSRRTPGPDALAFDDPAVTDAIARATHILSSVPPEEDADPVLARYGDAIRASGATWIGYLSSTGVYGDHAGAWVDEGTPVGQGRRSARIAADLSWQALGSRVHVFRLPGIYGPGRSALDRVSPFRVDAPGHRFSRIHVDDIAGAVTASMRAPRPGVYNLTDDLPATSAEVTAHACALLGRAPPPLIPLAEAPLSPMARGFYSERRVVANGKMTRCLGYRLRYPDYRAGLRACLEEMER
jgi:nucleoside-diphosphate-sugar epimerase